MGGNGGSGGRSGDGGLGSATHGGGGPTQSNPGGVGIVTGAAPGGTGVALGGAGGGGGGGGSRASGGFGGGGGAGGIIHPPRIQSNDGGFGAGRSGHYAGGGGAGMGGAVFVMQGGSLTIVGNTTQSGGNAWGGAAGNVAISGSPGQNGSAFGAGMFLQGNGSFSFSPEAAQTQSFADTIADQSGSGGTGANAGSWAVVKSGAGTLRLGGGNTYTGATQLAADTLQIASSASLGSAGALTFSGGTLQVTAAAGTLARGVTFNAGAARFQVDSGASLTWPSPSAAMQGS